MIERPKPGSRVVVTLGERKVEGTAVARPAGDLPGMVPVRALDSYEPMLVPLHLVEPKDYGPVPDPTTVDPDLVLAAPMRAGNDAKATTVREYLWALLTRLWVEEDEFSGKYPWGNSGWVHHFDEALVDANLIEGTVDEDGCLTEADTDARDLLIFAAIDRMCGLAHASGSYRVNGVSSS